VIANQVASNPEAALIFAFDNNLEAIHANLQGIGMAMEPGPPTWSGILNAVSNMHSAADFEEVFTFPYIADKMNWTAHLEEYLGPNQLREEGETAGWIVIVNGIVQLGSAVFGWLASQNNAEQALLQYQAQQEWIEYQEALEEQNKIFGVPKTLVYITAALVAILIIIVAVKKS
jgi:hypothetical protein